MAVAYSAESDAFGLVEPLQVVCVWESAVSSEISSLCEEQVEGLEADDEAATRFIR